MPKFPCIPECTLKDGGPSQALLFQTQSYPDTLLFHALSFVATATDFLFTPLIGGIIDAFGRSRAVQLACTCDTATFLLLGLAPSLPSYLLWQITREFSRRALKPARCGCPRTCRLRACV